MARKVVNKFNNSAKRATSHSVKSIKQRNKINYAKKKNELKLKRMDAKTQAQIANTQLKAQIKTQKAGKKYGFDPSLTSEQKTQLQMSKMKHDTARIATSEAVGSVTSLTGGLGGSAISMQQAEFGRANDPVIPKPDRDQGNSSSPIPGQNPGSGSLDDILGSIGKY